MHISRDNRAFLNFDLAQHFKVQEIFLPQKNCSALVASLLFSLSLHQMILNPPAAHFEQVLFENHPLPRFLFLIVYVLSFTEQIVALDSYSTHTQSFLLVFRSNLKFLQIHLIQTRHRS